MKQPKILGKRVLLVEDDQAARESIRLLLNIDRHTVFEARNGHEALELLRQHPFDLVILDFFMPGMQGNELAAKIKSTSPSLPILMVTAYVEKLGETDKPVDAVLSKPFGFDELREAIAGLSKGKG